MRASKKMTVALVAEKTFGVESEYFMDIDHPPAIFNVLKRRGTSKSP
jgi:hypothetical protein